MIISSDLFFKTFIEPMLLFLGREFTGQAVEKGLHLIYLNVDFWGIPRNVMETVLLLNISKRICEDCFFISRNDNIIRGLCFCDICGVFVPRGLSSMQVSNYVVAFIKRYF